MHNFLLVFAMAAAGLAGEVLVPPPSQIIGAESGAQNSAATLPLNAIPAGTIVELEFVDTVDSKANKVGDKIALKVAEPVMFNDKISIAAGLPVVGEVIHAAKARVAGKPGELILIARYIDMDGKQIPLKGFKFGNSGTGKSLVDESSAVALIVAAPLALFIVGGEKHAAPGMRAHAKLKEQFQLEAIGENAPEMVSEHNIRKAD